jgi:hypothetical protein
MKFGPLLFFCLILTIWPSFVTAQNGNPVAKAPVINAARLNPGETMDVDGRLDEPVWQRAELAGDFTQSDPHNGEPATERTEIRVTFDRDNLYIGAELFDSDAGGLLANQMVRDGSLNGDDRFMWTLDPFYDQRSGYFFEINPAGAMGDAQLIPAQGTSEVGNTTQNRAWDGIWVARVRRHDQGWTAEIQIPFRTLNFNPQAQAWGANFQRTVRRKNEESFWTGWARNQGLFNLASAGRIEGIHDVSQGRGLDIKPYLIGTYREAVRNGTSSTYKGDGGVDFFYNLTPQLKMNLTLNTDFAQTEVDDRQVNLTRFPLFFPEKRDFFLEGTGNFDFARERFNSLTAFFSRRIGLTANGQPQKIDYGVKMTGQARGINLGLMQVRTAEENGVPGEDFTVFRPKHSFLSQSYVGLIYTRRATRNSPIPDRHTIGGDFQLATTRFHGSQNLQFGAFYMKTPNAAKKGDDAGWGVRLDYPNDLWNFQLNFKDFQRNFDPAMGFRDRAGFRKLTQILGIGPRPKNSRVVRRVSMQARNEFIFDMQGRWLERTYNVTLLDLNMHSGDSATIGVTPSYERLDSNFRVAPGITLPAGKEYQYTRYSFEFATADRRTISGNGNVSVGTFYSGHRRDLAAGLNLRPRRGILATFSSSFNRVELPEGRFSTKILRAIINTQFSPFTSISNNLQYDSVSRVFGWQFRFRWILKPGNDIYFVWMNNWLDSGDRLTTLDRSAATKIVYTYRF